MRAWMQLRDVFEGQINEGSGESDRGVGGRRYLRLQGVEKSPERRGRHGRVGFRRAQGAPLAGSEVGSQSSSLAKRSEAAKAALPDDKPTTEYGPAPARTDQKIGEYLESLSALNKVAVNRDAVFIFVPAEKSELAEIIDEHRHACCAKDAGKQQHHAWIVHPAGQVVGLLRNFGTSPSARRAGRQQGPGYHGSLRRSDRGKTLAGVCGVIQRRRLRAVGLRTIRVQIGNCGRLMLEYVTNALQQVAEQPLGLVFALILGVVAPPPAPVAPCLPWECWWAIRARRFRRTARPP